MDIVVGIEPIPSAVKSCKIYHQAMLQCAAKFKLQGLFWKQVGAKPRDEKPPTKN